MTMTLIWHLMVVPLHDFDVILGNDFFVAASGIDTAPCWDVDRG